MVETVKDGKTFFKVTDLTDYWYVFEKELTAMSEKQDEKTAMHFLLIAWQIRCQLTMAQQMTMIAQRLGNIEALLDQGVTVKDGGKTRD